ncbi:glycosyl hydrolase family 43 protein [Biscogniauxia marginata]|nr:glycosyl hydrolase family 43 protein [Biscogniauxia marginata]
MSLPRLLLTIVCAATVAAPAAPRSPPPATIRHRAVDFESTGNPILADGSYYSADPAPLVTNGTLYIVAGRDEAEPAENSFVINEWEVLSTAADPSLNPAGGARQWTLHPAVVRPDDVFTWASVGTAYAAQVVRGAADGRFYLYAPVTQRDAGAGATDPFAIGVGVADSPLGPFEDAHPSGPIISQTTPALGNDIQNIDPTVLVDDDGRVYIYFGTFGQLLAYELDGSDMTTILGGGAATRIDSLTGFFEAPWLMKRQETYYMLYAANNAGADSPCTPTSYHACIAYGTASAPLGPWTYRGIVLDIVSSTTSHPGVFEIDGQWYLVYHTRDATGGTHFRRSVAFDALEWDDSTSPPSIRKVVQTRRPAAEGGDSDEPTRNIAPRAIAESANETPIQYWIAAVNDGRVEANPLPPDYWSSYTAEQSPETSMLTYTWNETVQLDGTSVAFFADQEAGSDIGVKFETVSTTGLRVVLKASGRTSQFGGIGVKEWFAFAPTAS